VRHNRRRTLGLWALQLGPGLLICVAVFATRPGDERWNLAGALLLYVAVIVVFGVIVARDRRGADRLRAPSAPGSVVFVTQNVPGAMVYLERFVVPGVAFARGRSFVIMADDAGIAYATPGASGVVFARIPRTDVAQVAEMAGELCITLVDGNPLLHVPGGMLPFGVRRVRLLASELSALGERPATTPLVE
jgi:hypothetical protein